MNASKHLEILDAYGGEKLLPFKQNTEAAYRLYMQLKQKCAAFASDQETRLREMDFCRFEIEEIENAALKDGEEEKVAADFKRFSNARRIAESLSQHMARCPAMRCRGRSVRSMVRWHLTRD